MHIPLRHCWSLNDVLTRHSLDIRIQSRSKNRGRFPELAGKVSGDGKEGGREGEAGACRGPNGSPWGCMRWVPMCPRSVERARDGPVGLLAGFCHTTRPGLSREVWLRHVEVTVELGAGLGRQASHTPDFSWSPRNSVAAASRPWLAWRQHQTWVQSQALPPASCVALGSSPRCLDLCSKERMLAPCRR